jgi:hypothetical protein
VVVNGRKHGSKRQRKRGKHEPSENNDNLLNGREGGKLMISRLSNRDSIFVFKMTNPSSRLMSRIHKARAVIVSYSIRLSFTVFS